MGLVTSPNSIFSTILLFLKLFLCMAAWMVLAAVFFLSPIAFLLVVPRLVQKVLLLSILSLVFFLILLDSCPNLFNRFNGVL